MLKQQILTALLSQGNTEEEANDILCLFAGEAFTAGLAYELKERDPFLSDDAPDFETWYNNQ